MAPSHGKSVQGLGAAGQEVNLIEAPKLSTAGSKDGLKSPEDSSKHSPKTYAGNKGSNISFAKNGKTQKYSPNAAEVCPTREKPVLQKKQAKKSDIGNTKEVKGLQRTMKSSSLVVSNSSDQEKCPEIQKGLTQQKRIHHSNYRNKDNSSGTLKTLRDRDIIVSPTSSRKQMPKFTVPNTYKGSQTDITMRDFSPTRSLTRNPLQKIFAHSMNDINNTIPLKRTDTMEILPKRNFYKEHLQNEVLNWLLHVPMFFSINVTNNKDIQNNVVRNLVDTINALAAEVNKQNYEVNVKMEIETCLNKLPMWLHGPKEDQTLFKCSLRERLWNKILELNKIFLGRDYKKHEDTNERLDESFEKEMLEWSQILQLEPVESITRRQIVDLIIKKLSPLLKIPLHTTNHKLIIKGEIIDILDNLSLNFTNSKYRTVQLNKLAEDLANRLLSLQTKQGTANFKNVGVDTSVFQQVTSQVTGSPIPINNYKKIISKRIEEYLYKLSVNNRNDLKTEICSCFFDPKYGLRTASQKAVKDEICQFLQDTGKISWDKAPTVANAIFKQVNDALKDVRQSASTSFDYEMPHLSKTVPVFNIWGQESPPATSTPKKIKTKDVPKLSPEETSYLNKVAAVVRIWMKTLPKNYDEEPEFQNTVIYDLAGDIMDHQKLQQLVPDSTTDKQKYQKYLIYKWICKFDIYEEDKLRTESARSVADFQRRLNKIPVPNLTASQHGTRQEMEHIKHMERDGGWDEDYVPRGIDVLEDQISVWLNEQPSEVLRNIHKGKQRNEMVHDLALNLQDHLRNKNAESEIEEDINQWLNKIVNTKEKENIVLLTQDLKDKIINLPQDRTLGVRHEERHRDILAKIAAKRQLKAGELPTPNEEDVSNFGNIQGDPDKTITEFIGKYIEHYYDIDDPMATGAFAHLLKTELRKLAPPTRKEIYENFKQLKTHQRFSPDSLNMELEYIKIISDWLNNIPIDTSYNTVGNRRRIEFINDLARNIIEIEDQRVEDPNAMDYNYLIASTILTSMNTYDLPIPREHRDNTHIMAHQLLEKLVDLRPPDVNATQASTSGSGSLSSSIIMGDIKEQNLSDFINDYIRINGRDIADDELKLEAWTARLMKEVKKIINEGADPATLTKAHIYEKFSSVPIPTQESVAAFGLKMNYVKEISDWMKNLPLLPIDEQTENGEERIRMICKLAKKMCDTQALRRANPNDKSADKELIEYITTWITSLPLDKSKEIILPILIQQLMSRMKKDSKQNSNPSLEKQQETSKSVDKRDRKRSISKKKSSIILKRLSKDKLKTPAEIIVEAIENWSNKLPIHLDDKDTVKSMKERIARQLYQKIGELNVDPRIFNDELLYREMLEDEIETQLENVPQNSELQDNREKIIEKLMDEIIITNKIIKERSAGENYRHKLETTIDASIPNPVQSTQAFDPGFEIYKNHLADMFILENYDHANDDVKAKHERRVRHELDKYFEYARNKNALPLTKDQIYNEIYSALFKVPMPNENSVIDEVEQIKTRCEIDAWYEKLPIQQTDNINELLERDQILSTLAKRIQEIEKSGYNVDENINKETRKWLKKLSLKSGNGSIDEYVKQLQSLLQSTAAARKYVAPKKESKGKIRKLKENIDKKRPKSPNTSQVPGPSGALQTKATHAKPCLLVSPMTHKKPGDIITEIVEEWCNQLPLISTEDNNKVIRDNISTRIIIQISELNMDPNIFNDDVMYDELLDEELEDIMSNLPLCCDFAKSKSAWKHQLKVMIKSIKSLIIEEKARHQYKQELNSTVSSVLKEPHDASADKLAIFNQLKEEIVENFLQYYYYINDEEAKQFYKDQIHDRVVRFCIEIRDKGTGDKVDPLVKRNQLLCELLKIPVPVSALKEEVAEIKMKKEVETFLHELSIPEGNAETTMTKHLAKRLCDIEKSGYNPLNEKKMNTDITRCLSKFKKDISSETVDSFVKKLKYNEAERKTPPITSSQATDLNQDGAFGSPTKPHEKGRTVRQAQPPEKRIHCSCQTSDSFKSAVDESSNAMPTSNYYSPVSMHPTARHVWSWSPNEAQRRQSLTDSPIEYENLRTENLLNSSAVPQCCSPHALTPDHLSISAGRPSLHSNASFRNVQPFRHFSHQSLNTCYPQNQLMREAMSGLTLSRQSYGQTAPVRLRPQTRGTTSPRNITSDSFFDVPLFGPAPYPCPALPTPILNPYELPGRTASEGVRRPRRSKDQENALPCMPMPKTGQPGERRLGVHSLNNEICICKICSRRTQKGIPYCLMTMDHDFDDCLGFPLWYCMHLPKCFYKIID